MKTKWKTPKCSPCEFEVRLRAAKDGAMIAVSVKCEGCGYVSSNFEVAK